MCEPSIRYETALCTSGHVRSSSLVTPFEYTWDTPYKRLHSPQSTCCYLILSCVGEVWEVDINCCAAAEFLQLDFLRCLIDVRKSTANHMVLAELGRFPLQDKSESSQLDFLPGCVGSSLLFFPTAQTPC